MVLEEEEALKRKHAEEALNRKAKATVHADVCTTPLKLFKHYGRKKPLVKQVICKKCGKTFKTNRDKKLCFSCERKKP
jgi:pyrimidine deaminase RibD-like protein